MTIRRLPLRHYAIDIIARRPRHAAADAFTICPHAVSLFSAMSLTPCC